jgi:hypothetical protein
MKCKIQYACRSALLYIQPLNLHIVTLPHAKFVVHTGHTCTAAGAGFSQPYAVCPSVPGGLPASDAARDCCRHFAYCVPRWASDLAVLAVTRDLCQHCIEQTPALVLPILQGSYLQGSCREARWLGLESVAFDLLVHDCQFDLWLNS